MSERTLSRYLTAMKDVDLDKDSPPISVGYSSRKVILIKHLFLVNGELTGNILKLDLHCRPREGDCSLHNQVQRYL